MHLSSNLTRSRTLRVWRRMRLLALVGGTTAVIFTAAVAPHVSAAGSAVGSQQASAKKGSGSGTSTTTSTVSPLSYHGGSVFNTPYTVHDVYWVPSGYGVISGYQTTIDGFIRNLAAASGASTNVFNVATQYADGSGSHVVNSARFGGSTTVTTPLPASGCKDSGVKNAPCLTDVQVASEIKAVASAQGWTVGYPNIYALMMPKGVGNCATTSTGSLEGYCSFGRSACAWHHQWGGLYFIVMPDPATAGGCETGQSPNNVPEADSAIDLFSHELNETLTNPADGSWYDGSGQEVADKCQSNFGSPVGGTTGHLFNQVINGTGYYMQAEWSNASSGCAL